MSRPWAVGLQRNNLNQLRRNLFCWYTTPGSSLTNFLDFLLRMRFLHWLGAVYGCHCHGRSGTSIHSLASTPQNKLPATSKERYLCLERGKSYARIKKNFMLCRKERHETDYGPCFLVHKVMRSLSVDLHSYVNSADTSRYHSLKYAVPVCFVKRSFEDWFTVSPENVLCRGK